jgi:glycosyltransferase involved in cell wall biosynthesis
MTAAPSVAPPAAESPAFSVVIPTIGSEAKLLPLLEALARQTLPRERWETIVSFDGAEPTPEVARRLAAIGARVVRVEPRQGPPIARNRGAALARGAYLVSADDDVVPEPDWLQRAAARFAAEPGLDVLEGVTRKPGGRPVRMHGDESPQYILCNLFIRRTLFERIGGFHEGYFDADNGVFFREDADLGYTLEAAGARVGREPGAVVTHPIEHPRFLDPLRWAERYEMDALLAKRYPKRFRDRIEIHKLGPFTVRRPIVRASYAYAAALLAALVAALVGWRGAALASLAVAGLAFVPIWAKWRFDVKRLPVYLLVPFALIAALARGRARVRRLGLG